MSEEPDPRIALIEDAFDAFNERDVEGLVGFLHPQVESHVSPELMNTGTWTGFAGFAEMTAGWQDVWGNMKYDLRGIELVDERHALVAVHQAATGAQSGVPVALDVVYLIEFEAQQAIRFQVHTSRESALAAVT